MKTLLPFLLLFVTATSSVFGTHILGNRITYEQLDSSTVRVYSTIYYDCGGSAFNSNLIPVGSTGLFPSGPIFSFVSPSPSCTDSSISTWQNVSFTDISRLCPLVTNSCQSVSGTYAGVAEHTGYRDYRLSGNCGEVTISMAACCRSGILTSGAANNGIYNSAYMVFTPNLNTSPQYLDHPRIYVCNSDTTVVNLGAVDAEGDSLVYELDTAWASSSVNIIYSAAGGFSPTSPLGQFWDVDIDPITGALTIIGNNAQPEIGVALVKLSEYRNGVLIGYTKIEFVLHGINCQNDAPSAGPVQVTSGGSSTGSHAILGYTGVPLEFDIVFEDDSNAVLILDSLLGYNLPGAVITVSGTNPLQVSISWTPDSSYEGTSFYYGPTVRDDACPTPASTYQPILFEIEGFSLNDSLVNSDCQVSNGSIFLDPQGGPGPYTYNWSTGATSQNLTGLAPGTYIVQISDPSGPFLTKTYTLNSGSLVSTAFAYEPGCGLSDGAISVSASGGNPPYTYSWSNGATTDSISNLQAGFYSVTVRDALGCQSLESLSLIEDDSCKVIIEGKVYYDFDDDCIKDSLEIGMKNIFVSTTTGYGTFTDSLGNYSLAVPTGTYDLMAFPPNNQSSCTPLVYTITQPTTGVVLGGNDFPWYHPPFQDLEARHCPFIARPGFSNFACVEAINNSNIPVAATLTLNYDSLITPFNFSITPTVFDSVNHIVSWNLGVVDAFDSEFIVLEYQISASAVFRDTLMNVLTVSPITGDSIPQNNVDSLQTLTRFPYDPNNKTVLPSGIGELGLIKPEQVGHDYTIRFQNLGNFYAQNVLIRDTLGPNLDITTLKPLSASDEYVLRSLPGGILEFYFENIFLPDSATDPLGSIGEVSFRIEHLPGLSKGSQIKNRAGIYFDFNDPIITNYAVNTLYIQPEIEIPFDPSAIYCDGSKLTALLATEGMEPYSYLWNTGDSAIRINDIQHEAILNGSGTYVVTVVDSFGFSATDSIEVRVSVPPNIDITWTTNGTEFIFNAGDSSITSYQWVFNNGDRSNEAQPSLDTDGLSSLSVLLFAANECGGDTANSEVIVAGVEREAGFGKIRIVPHPVQDISILTFNNPLKEEISLDILDTRGKTVKSFVANKANSFQIDSSSLPSGIYLYRLSNKEGKTQYGKIILR